MVEVGDEKINFKNARLVSSEQFTTDKKNQQSKTSIRRYTFEIPIEPASDAGENPDEYCSSSPECINAPECYVCGKRVSQVSAQKVSPTVPSNICPGPRQLTQELVATDEFPCHQPRKVRDITPVQTFRSDYGNKSPRGSKAETGKTAAKGVCPGPRSRSGSGNKSPTGSGIKVPSKAGTGKTAEKSVSCPGTRSRSGSDDKSPTGSGYKVCPKAEKGVFGSGTRSRSGSDNKSPTGSGYKVPSEAETVKTTEKGTCPGPRGKSGSGNKSPRGSGAETIKTAEKGTCPGPRSRSDSGDKSTTGSGSKVPPKAETTEKGVSCPGIRSRSDFGENSPTGSSSMAPAKAEKGVSCHGTRSRPGSGNTSPTDPCGKLCPRAETAEKGVSCPGARRGSDSGSKSSTGSGDKLPPKAETAEKGVSCPGARSGADYDNKSPTGSGDKLCPKAETADKCISCNVCSSGSSSSSSSSDSESSESSTTQLCSCCKRESVRVSRKSSEDSAKFILCHACCRQNKNSSPYAAWTVPGHVCTCYGALQAQTVQRIKETIKELDALEKDDGYCNCATSKKHSSGRCARCNCKLKDKAKFNKGGLAYVLTLEPENKKHHRKHKKEKQHSLPEIRIQVESPHKQQNRRSSNDKKDLVYTITETSNEESSKENRACHRKKHKKKRKPTLQEYLSANKPNFVVSAEERRQCLLDLALMREKRCQKYKQLLAMTKDLPPQGGDGAPRKRELLFPPDEMKKITARHYKKLPEVQQKLLDNRDKQIKTANRLLANIFNQKLRQQVLKGQHTLPADASVINLIP